MSAALHTLSLSELANAIARGETTSRAATESSLSRLKNIGTKLNAKISIL